MNWLAQYQTHAITALVVMFGLYLVIKAIKDKSPKPGSLTIKVDDEKYPNPEFKKRIEIILDTIKRVDPDTYRRISGAFDTIIISNNTGDVFGDGFRHIQLYGGYCAGAMFFFSPSVKAGVKQNVITIAHEAAHVWDKGISEAEADKIGIALYEKLKGKF